MKTLVLQSGFLFVANPYLSQQKNNNSSIVSNIQNSFKLDDRHYGWYSADMERLFKLYRDGKITLRNLDFIKELKKCVNRLFSSLPIEAWFKLQKETKFASALHKAFYKDAYAIFHSDENTKDLNIYLGLLSVSEVPPACSVDYADCNCVSNMVLMQNVMCKQRGTNYPNPTYGLEQFLGFLKVVTGRF